MMMTMDYLMKAHGNGDLEQSPIFQGTMDWLFKVIVARHCVQEEDIPGLRNLPHFSDVMQAPPYELSQYELLHDFMNHETVMVVPTQSSNESIEEFEADGYMFTECIAEVVKAHTIKWLEEEGVFRGAQPGAMNGFVNLIATGMITSLFKINIQDGELERMMAKRCVGSLENQTFFKETFGIEKAIKHFPRSEARGRWLEDELGM